MGLVKSEAIEAGTSKIAVSALGTGTPDGTKFLRDDQTWATPPGGGGDAFGTIAVSGQSNVVADTSNDTLTLVGGNGVTITTDAGTDAVTFATSAAQSHVTSLGTLTALQVDNINVNGNAISSGTSALDLTGSPALVTAGISVNQAVTVSGTGFGSALGFFGSVTQGSDGNAVIGIDLNNLSLGTGGFVAGTHYGIRIPAINSGATNYSIYSNGGALYHAGVAGIGISHSSTAQVTLPASTTGVAPLRITHGTAPSSPVNGDVWTTTAGMYVRVSGTTVGPLAAASVAGNTLYAPGSVTVATGNFAMQVKNLTLTSTQRLTLAGTARFRLSN